MHVQSTHYICAVAIGGLIWRLGLDLTLCILLYLMYYRSGMPVWLILPFLMHSTVILAVRVPPYGMYRTLETTLQDTPKHFLLEVDTKQLH